LGALGAVLSPEGSGEILKSRFLRYSFSGIFEFYR
jgi:hypothetical protein